MKSCILTVIKDEQEYLDEWINYHLKLGIDHIFIIEDFDSDSHKEITDKYSDVTLFEVKQFLNKELYLKALQLKMTKKKSPQIMYFNLGIDYIKSKYLEFNWCFLIDVDEFITLEKDKTLQDIFIKYDNYEAFTMQWETYGANGLVHKPDYSIKGVIDTYIEPMKGKLLDTPDCYVKTCYNLNKYKKGYIYNAHHPSKNCINWCNTEYELNSYKTTYKNIYIRHYITKSLEEYVWKKETRGMNTRIDKYFKMFFSVNPEMEDKRTEYLKELHPETLVILPFDQKFTQGNEIKLCLNAWKKFCTFEYHFIVIGEFDNSLTIEFPWVEFIYYPTINNSCINTFNKIYSLGNYYSSYQNFILIFNNQYAIKPFTLEDIKTTYYLSNEIKEDSNDSQKTKKLLLEQKHSIVNYSTNYPIYFNFNKIFDLDKKYNLQKENYILENLYFNIFPPNEIVQIDNIRLNIRNNDIYKEYFQEALINKNIKFICNNIDGWSEELEYELNNLINN